MSAAYDLAVAIGAPIGEVDGRKTTPMLCERDATRERVLAEPGFTYEVKLDGVRIVADKAGDRVSLSYRKLRDASASYPEIADAVRALGEERVVLDGEIVAFDAEGRPDFQRLATRIHTRRDARRAGAPVTEVQYVVFDVLAIGDRDLRGLPIEARREILARVVDDGGGAGPAIRANPTFDDGAALFAACKERRLEGVVAKRARSTYRAGDRSADWVKVKCDLDADFVVVAWAEGEGRRARLGALDLAAYEPGDPPRLVVRGAVGSGLDEDTIDALLDALAPLATDRPTAEGKLSPKAKRTHVRPEIVVSVRYMGTSNDGILRHPVFRGVRADVDAKDCFAPETDASAPRMRVTARAAEVLPGLSKDALCNHYAALADAILPHAAGRACMFVKADGAPLWPLPRWTPSWVKTWPAPGARGVVVDHVDALLFGVEAGAVGLVAIGLPALRASRAGAAAARAIAEAIGVASYPKAAGGGAVDVVFALGDTNDETARALLALVARLAHERSGEMVEVAGSPAAPWSIVVDDGGARVSVPFRWTADARGDALDLDCDPARALAVWRAAGDPSRSAPVCDVAGAVVALESLVTRRG